jgi:hypothetical protein
LEGYEGIFSKYKEYYLSIDHFFMALVSDKALHIHSWLDWMSED